jgi:hypothetical protein
MKMSKNDTSLFTRYKPVADIKEGDYVQIGQIVLSTQADLRAGKGDKKRVFAKHGDENVCYRGTNMKEVNQKFNKSYEVMGEGLIEIDQPQQARVMATQMPLDKVRAYAGIFKAEGESRV